MPWRSPMQSALADKELQAQAAGLEGPSLVSASRAPPADVLTANGRRKAKRGRWWIHCKMDKSRIWWRGRGGLPLESSGNGSLGGFWPAVKLGVNSRCWRGLLLFCHRESQRGAQTKSSALPLEHLLCRHISMISRGFLSWLFAKLALPTSEEQDEPPTWACCEAAEINLCQGKFFLVWNASMGSWKRITWVSLEKLLNSPFGWIPIAAADKKDKTHYKLNFQKVL